MSRELQTINSQSKLALWAERISECRNSAVMFSLIRTAIENGLDPYRYLTWMMNTANNADLRDPETVQLLLPWKAPAECRTK